MAEARPVSQAARPVQIVSTGLRPGEKLREVLLAGDDLGIDLDAGELTAHLQHLGQRALPDLGPTTRR